MKVWLNVPQLRRFRLINGEPQISLGTLFAPVDIFFCAAHSHIYIFIETERRAGALFNYLRNPPIIAGKRSS